VHTGDTFFNGVYAARPGEKSKKFPGGATGLVTAAIILVGVEVFALGIFGVKAWGNIYFTQPGADAMPVQVQAGQFAFYRLFPRAVRSVIRRRLRPALA
jgi:hypothetical protein